MLAQRMGTQHSRPQQTVCQKAQQRSIKEAQLAQMHRIRNRSTSTQQITPRITLTGEACCRGFSKALIGTFTVRDLQNITYIGSPLLVPPCRSLSHEEVAQLRSAAPDFREAESSALPPQWSNTTCLLTGRDLSEVCMAVNAMCAYLLKYFNESVYRCASYVNGNYLQTVSLELQCIRVPGAQSCLLPLALQQCPIF